MPGGYLVEFRVRDGWDGNIPRPAVLAHRFAAGHSYLMPGNLGSFDLIAGDSFRDAEPAGQSVASLFEAFKRVDVLSIDAAAQQATIRVSRLAGDPSSPRAQGYRGRSGASRGHAGRAGRRAGQGPYHATAREDRRGGHGGHQEIRDASPVTPATGC